MPDDVNSNGCPTKLIEEFMAAMMDVINSEDNALIYTDEELVFLINEQLAVEARIHPDMFSLWKNGKIADDVRAQKFFSVYKRALLKQKRNLFGKIDDPVLGEGCEDRQQLHQRPCGYGRYKAYILLGLQTTPLSRDRRRVLRVATRRQASALHFASVR